MKFELRPKPGVQPQEMPETLQKRLTAALQGDNDEALRQVLGEASTFAHPDTTVVDRGDKKPGATRLLRSLEHLSVPPDVPVTSLMATRPPTSNSCRRWPNKGVT
ncbi:hypothetical protein [Ralstonia pseudosolanacearum]|uniref:hypothetical protein n=1 Tax=Ralstonia pseudosolanacearum TaxID=1310165 RepID=UPI001FFB8168|nr:hypothetical protein [Ralstonia pseudosolanacearum]